MKGLGEHLTERRGPEVGYWRELETKQEGVESLPHRMP
jgi:hypothetical protein